MRKLLNTLYVTSTDSYLSRDGENVVIKHPDKDPFRVPIHNLESIITFGYMGASPSLMHLCSERGVALNFLDENGRFLAGIRGEVTGNVLLRRKQYRMADGEESLEIAKRFVSAKIHNSRVAVNRGIRDHGDNVELEVLRGEAGYLKRYIEKAMVAKQMDELRGIEGDAARRYFRAFGELILVNKDSFFMKERSRRPPMDATNALLSYLYTILQTDMVAALETVGLDPAVGFLHRDRPGRPSLALDLMEEFRCYLVDRLVLSLINRKQISGNDFVEKENGAVLLKKDIKKDIIEAWQKRKRDEITHPFLDEKIPIGLLPYVQALLLARYIRGDMKAYPPFLWK